MIKIIRLSGSRVVVLLLDCLFIYISYLLAYTINFQGNVPQEQWNSFYAYAPWLGMFTALTYYFFNLYNFAGRQKPAKWLYNLLLADLVFVVELILLHYWLESFSLPRSVVVIACLIQLALTFALRLTLFFIQTKGIGKKRALLVISNHSSSIAIIKKLKNEGKVWFELRHLLVVDQETSTLGEVCWEEVDTLILGPDISAPVRTELIRQAGHRDIEVLLIPDFYELYLMKAELQQIDDLLLYSMMPPALTIWERMVKRGIDLVVSSILLLLASPVMLLMFVLIPATSKGKALFYQERVGIHGTTFRVMKFRSMVDNAEKHTGPVLASSGDARITKLGHFIRATRIDELPQLFNVIRGDMSLVGPRPERPYFVEQFEKELPHYSYRLMVKPGLTGMAQVMANYTTLPSDKLRYDIMYIKNYSPLLDLKILFQTVLVVLQREQSKGLQAEAKDFDNIEDYLRQVQMEVAPGRETP
ncbi:sugar transferase [Paenibacillus barengoltzii]|uniref:Exopolysaccharide biosynthesis polyprenyl glycosylphosphotransferase n=1 Tax=Paenibacillus barengoltzii G22 TaxID=1235795 RepID=R9LF19_9BACL|nr:sugar transferase [Paenibacillus barengoltzii]EOS54327.1 exopolysaccharide biosynthesis polyprenyl glycosylphosphotransferase [Paenibacillus barengoltzii G22]